VFRAALQADRLTVGLGAEREGQINLAPVDAGGQSFFGGFTVESLQSLGHGHGRFQLRSRTIFQLDVDLAHNLTVSALPLEPKGEHFQRAKCPVTTLVDGSL
jgi:hypothetical protein